MRSTLAENRWLQRSLVLLVVVNGVLGVQAMGAAAGLGFPPVILALPVAPGRQILLQAALRTSPRAQPPAVWFPVPVRWQVEVTIWEHTAHPPALLARAHVTVAWRVVRSLAVSGLAGSLALLGLTGVLWRSARRQRARLVVTAARGTPATGAPRGRDRRDRQRGGSMRASAGSGWRNERTTNGATMRRRTRMQRCRNDLLNADRFRL